MTVLTGGNRLLMLQACQMFSNCLCMILSCMYLRLSADDIFMNNMLNLSLIVLFSCATKQLGS